MSQQHFKFFPIADLLAQARRLCILCFRKCLAMFYYKSTISCLFVSKTTHHFYYFVEMIERNMDFAFNLNLGSRRIRRNAKRNKKQENMLTITQIAPWSTIYKYHDTQFKSRQCQVRVENDTMLVTVPDDLAVTGTRPPLYIVFHVQCPRSPSNI